VSELLAGQASVYVAPQIPRLKEQNARKGAAVPGNEKGLILFGYTAFGSAENCPVAAESGIFYHNKGAYLELFSIGCESL
jgi:hypothetical protein